MLKKKTPNLFLEWCLILSAQSGLSTFFLFFKGLSKNKNSSKWCVTHFVNLYF